MSVKQAAEELLAALRTVPDLRVHNDLGANLEPPAVILGAPALGWRSFCRQPTSARFVVFIVVAADDRALESLWDLVPQVATAVEDNMQAAAIQDGPSAALPTTFYTAGIELPCYELTIEVDL